HEEDRGSQAAHLGTGRGRPGEASGEAAARTGGVGQRSFMPRVKRSVHGQKKRREVMAAAKGYYGARSRRYRVAKEQVLHSGVYAYRDRRDRKGQFRRLWITRIGAAARQGGMIL